MTDRTEAIATLQRPRLLIRAARLGLPDYRRNRDLRRLIGVAEPPGPGRTVPLLVAAEAAVEATRRAGDVGYSIARHIALLIALIAETRLLGAEGR
jgi:hypothetical protein